jgi:hypothetical protein
MPRLFEIGRHEVDGDVRAIVDLDKVCLVRVEKEKGHHYPKLLVRFVDGHETDAVVPPADAQRFLDAYRTYLQERPGGPG